jgi:putative endonuclease
MSKRNYQHQTDINRFGSLAEYIARLYLRIKLYKIVASDFKHPAGQIDIIATKSNTVVFIEVKARKQQAYLNSALNYKQLQRIENSAQHFCLKFKRFSNYNKRFDLILISTKRPYIRHIKNIAS